MMKPTEPLTVALSAQATVSITAPLQHRCPFVDEQDNGTVTITWRTTWRTLELHALRRYLDACADLVVSHEMLTEELAAALAHTPGIELVALHTTWDTAGMAVRCDAVLR